MTWLTPPPPLPPVSKLDRATHRKTEKERQLADGLKGGGGNGGAKSYGGEKAWSSINHSIFSVLSNVYSYRIDTTMNGVRIVQYLTAGESQHNRCPQPVSIRRIPVYRGRVA
jgi:hypothetical protein